MVRGSTMHLKSIPYGISDYSVICQSGYAFADKTKYIELLEKESPYTFIVRPRRFGKTLFSGMLEMYYDRLEKDNFARYFGNTYIGSHRTDIASSLMVLHFDFSGLSLNNIVRSFISRIKNSLYLFLNKYPDKNAEAVIRNSYDDPAELVDDFFTVISATCKNSVYVIIDEYDQFSNEVLSIDSSKFREITSSNGMLKNFYTVLKSATAFNGAISRIFITGVTPISIDSMTSGFNIASNLTNDQKYAAMFGFTEDELKELIAETIDPACCRQSREEIFQRMKELYDGYSFSRRSEEHVFNPSMSLYYLNALVKNNAEPEELMDPSFSADLSKIHGIFSLGRRDKTEGIVSAVTESQSIKIGTFSSVININRTHGFSEYDILSILYYFGYLTWHDDKVTLKIPNRTVRQQFFEYYFRYICGLTYISLTPDAFVPSFQALRNGDARPFVERVLEVLRECFRLNAYLHVRESDVSTAMTMAANFSADYRPVAGAEVSYPGKGYADLILQPVREGETAYFFELKYLSKEDGKNSSRVQMALEEAVRQLDRYRTGNNMGKFPHVQYIACVVAGLEIAEYVVC